MVLLVENLFKSNSVLEKSNIVVRPLTLMLIIFPLFRTTILSAFLIVDNLCAIIIPVRLFKIWFRAYLSGITDSISPNWESSTYIGRSEPVYTYTNTEREIGFNLKSS